METANNTASLTHMHTHTHTREEGHRDFSGLCYAQLASSRLRGDGVCHEDGGETSGVPFVLIIHCF